MATYAIGDLQGCYEPLQRLLDKIKFDPVTDELWFAGDIVNRGPDSLKCLRFVKSLGDRGVCVLGNHDLHLLAVYYNKNPMKKGDTLKAILDAEDCESLLHWLRHQPLIHIDNAQNWCMSHAGVPPIWDLTTALNLAKEVEQALANQHLKLFQSMYGNQPDIWSNSLEGFERLRIIINYLTRMRFIDMDGRLNLAAKEGINSAPPGYIPWFKHPSLSHKKTEFLFGHWAALEGKTSVQGVWALDTGCVWGGALTALRLEDQTLFSVPAH